MPEDPIDYRKLYTTIFNAITDALEALDQWKEEEAERLLEVAQEKTEELYVTEEDEVCLLSLEELIDRVEELQEGCP